MKQSEINLLLKEAAECLKKHNWMLLLSRNGAPPISDWVNMKRLV